MMPPQPLLQIVHVSDFHIGRVQGSGASARSALHKVPLISQARAKYYRGTQGHDHSAFRALGRSIDQRLQANPEWKPLTWLVATGDFSTWGDDPSVDAGLAHVKGIATRLGIEWCAIYGNHDVWIGQPGPSGLPIFCMPTPWKLDQRRSDLRRNQFPATWPLIPLNSEEATVAAGKPPMLVLSSSDLPKIAGYSLNTVVHNPTENSLAIGRVDSDRYWETNPAPPQLVDLAHRCMAPQLRLVFTHHPVHREPVPMFGEVLDNAGAVATELATAPNGRPIPTLVVSGHTHELFPKHGELPDRWPDGIPAPPLHHEFHRPLLHKQAQLTTGTLSQRNWGSFHQEHIWQLLRFGEDAQGIQLERIVYSRSGGAGAFKPMSDAAGHDAEHMRLG